MFSAAVPAFKRRLFPSTETGKRKAANALSRVLRLETKRPAAVVDFAGILKGGGGAYRGRTDDLLHAMQAL